MPYKKKTPTKSLSEMLASEATDVELESLSTENVMNAVADGSLVDRFIDEAKRYGENEIGDPLRWNQDIFENSLRAIADLRIVSVAISGCAQYFKTASCAQVNAWLTQRAGLRTLWSFPKQDTLHKLQPMQHSPLLRNWAKVSGISRITQAMRTSTSVFNVGRGSASFTSLNSSTSSSTTAAGTGAVAVTVEAFFAEEASQSPNAAIFPLYRRLDKGRMTEEFEVPGPRRLLGTPGNGAGIEAIMDSFTFNFWAHAWCEKCGTHQSLHPLGALLKSKKIRNDSGQLVTRWTDGAGMPLDWHYSDPESRLKSAFIGCPVCGTEFNDSHRSQPKFKCLNTGMFLDDLLKDYVPLNWKREDISIALWVPALGRPGNGRRLASAIMAEFTSPDVVEDLYQQRLGIPSTFLGGTITPKKIIDAIRRPIWVPERMQYGHNNNKTSSLDETIRILGMDQGRSANYYAVVEFLFRKNQPIPLQLVNAKRNILLLEPGTIDDLPRIMEQYSVQGGALDHAPNITMAAQIEQEYGLRSFAQKPMQIQDFKEIQAHDGGIAYEVMGIRDRKFARCIFSAFDAGKYSITDSYAYQIEERKRADSIFKHLTGVSMDSQDGKIIRAKDEVDDLFFALMYAEAAFGLYLEDPSAMIINLGWDWFNA